MKLTKEQKIEMFLTILENSWEGDKVMSEMLYDNLMMWEKKDSTMMHHAPAVMNMADVCGLNCFIMQWKGKTVITIF
jgi:hypothetical protein